VGLRNEACSSILWANYYSDVTAGVSCEHLREAGSGWPAACTNIVQYVKLLTDDVGRAPDNGVTVMAKAGAVPATC